MRLATFIRKYGGWVLSVFLLIILASIIGFYLHFKVGFIFSTYPEVHKLYNTNKLTCEPLINSRTVAGNTCDGKSFGGQISQVQDGWMEEGRRLTSGAGAEGDPWESKKEWGKANTLWRRDGNVIYTKQDMLIPELEDEQQETEYIIVKETETKIVAQTFEEQGKNISVGTLYLDKETGLLTISGSGNSYFCFESIRIESMIYSCREL